MNISMRDKKLLLMFSGVAVFGLGWFFGYRPQMEEAANIEAAKTNHSKNVCPIFWSLQETGIFISAKPRMRRIRSTSMYQNFLLMLRKKTESYLLRI